MKRLIPRPLHVLALVCVSFASLPAAPSAAAVTEPEWLATVAPYPQPDSPTAQSELAILLWLQTARTAQDVARVQSENTPSFGCFAQDITLYASPGLQSRPIELRDFPNTVAVLEHARQDVLPVLHSLQAYFNRPRPYVTYPGITPSLPAEAGPSYPSTHAALGVIFARILAQWDPADKASLEATGALLGTDRVLAGVHYPSDVVGGQMFGKAFATFWIDQPEHLMLIQSACAEWNR